MTRRQGGYRSVELHPDRSDLVVKTARSESGVRHNRVEWAVWNEYPELREWLAAVLSISDDGKQIVQVRGQELRDERLLPVTIPSVLVDAYKPANWVVIYGEARLCDYGHEQIMRNLKDSEGKFEMVPREKNGRVKVRAGRGLGYGYRKA